MLFRAERRAHDSSARTPVLGEPLTDLGVPTAPSDQVSPISRLRRRAGGRRLLLVVIVLLVLLVAALGLEIRRSQEERAALLDQIAAVAAEAAAVQAALSEAEGTTTRQGEDLATIVDALDAQRREAAALRGLLDGERSRAADLRAEFGAHQTLSAQRQQALSQEVAALTAQSEEQRRQLGERGQQLAERDQQLTERGQQVEDQGQQLTERDQQLAERDQQLAEHRRRLQEREAELARFSTQVETLSRRLAEMEALAARLRQTLGLPAPRGPAGGGQATPRAATPTPVAAGDLQTQLADLASRSEAATRELATLERALQQRIANLRALTAAGRRPLPAEAMAAAPIGRPVSGGNITSQFGMRESPFNGELQFHTGIDIAVRTGTPVQATREGVVVRVGDEADGYGLAVVVEHPGGFKTLYAHNSKSEVKVGDTVERGQVLALAGNTGASTGPHVHYEVLYQGTALDPAPFMALKAE